MCIHTTECLLSMLVVLMLVIYIKEYNIYNLTNRVPQIKVSLYFKRNKEWSSWNWNTRCISVFVRCFIHVLCLCPFNEIKTHGWEFSHVNWTSILCLQLQSLDALGHLEIIVQEMKVSKVSSDGVLNIQLLLNCSIGVVCIWVCICFNICEDLGRFT